MSDEKSSPSKLAAVSLFGSLRTLSRARHSRGQVAEACRRIRSFISAKTNPKLANAAMKIINRCEGSHVDIICKLRALCAPARAPARRPLPSLSDIKLSPAMALRQPCCQSHSAELPASRELSRLRDFTVEMNIIKASFPRDGLYLDIGCAEGAITKTVVDALKLSPEQAVACDPVVQPPNAAFTFKHTDGNSLPLKSGSVDVATMFMSAHHFVNPDVMFREAFRVMRPGSALIIREHDCADLSAALFYDVVHVMYACVLTAEMTPEEFTSAYETGTFTAYRSQHAWLQFAAEHGFTLHPDAPPHGPVVRGVYGKDRYNSFYAMFVRAADPAQKECEAV